MPWNKPERSTPPPPPATPQAFNPFTIAVCFQLDDPTVACLKQDEKQATRTLVDAIWDRGIVNVLFPRGYQLTNFSAQMKRLEDKALKIVEGQIRSDLQKLQPFAHDTAETRAAKMALVHAEGRRLQEFASEAHRAAADGSNWKSQPDLPSGSQSQRFYFGEDNHRRLMCVGAGIKAGCGESWTGERGKTLFDR